jgi:hypothetical protein
MKNRIKNLKGIYFCILYILTVCFVFSDLGGTSVWALDINKIANEKPAKKKEIKKRRITKELYFECIREIAVREDITEEPIKNFSPEFYCSYFDKYPMYDGNILQEVLTNSYGIEQHKYRSDWVQAAMELGKFNTLWVNFQEYYFIEYGFSSKKHGTNNAKKKDEVLSNISESVQWFTKNEWIKSKKDISGITNFIADFDKFTEKLYKEKSNQIKAYQAKKQEHAKLIKSGKKPIKNLNDAKIYYGAKDDMSIVTNPPLDGDNKNYAILGKFVRKEGEYFLAKHETSNDLCYFIFKFVGGTPTPDFRTGGKLNVVGKFIGVTSYNTVIGTERYMSVFEAYYIQM